MYKKLKINGVEKLAPNLFDKANLKFFNFSNIFFYLFLYVIHIRALDQALKHGLILEKSIEPSNSINPIG